MTARSLQALPSNLPLFYHTRVDISRCPAVAGVPAYRRGAKSASRLTRGGGCSACGPSQFSGLAECRGTHVLSHIKLPYRASSGVTRPDPTWLRGLLRGQRAPVEKVWCGAAIGVFLTCYQCINTPKADAPRDRWRPITCLTHLRCLSPPPLPPCLPALCRLICLFPCSTLRAPRLRPATAPRTRAALCSPGCLGSGTLSCCAALPTLRASPPTRSLTCA